jgi:putative tryptophan/tyrosine transport system substrate-binding protein
MRRREFITLLVGAALSWPFSARAQQSDRIRRVAVLLPATADNPEFQAWIGAFIQELGRLGWTSGVNAQIETRWATTNPVEIRRQAAELAALGPDVIVAAGTLTVAPMMQATKVIPIVFPIAIDPIGAGFVSSLSRPGGNVTGFMTMEYSLSGKWPELLKRIAPDVRRLGVLRDATQSSGTSQFAVIQAVAPLLGVEVVPINMLDAEGIERAVGNFAQAPNGGLIVTGGGVAVRYRNLIVTLAAKWKMPTIYFERSFTAIGGLMSYGPNQIDLFRQSAGYVDRILRGEKPAELPVQAPTKYELVINRKTAKSLGLEVPASFLAAADEVIE